ncbi:MAG: zinc metallopeptidase [Actinobacteria bacterium]|nr:zinc metallopeptidase [Actinomycetota bacterium]
MGWYWIILIIGLALGGLTQLFVNSSFKRFSKVALATGQSGAEVARRMLDAEGLHNVRIERVDGHLSDHYDPRTNVIRLSPKVHDGRTVSAAGVAAHEAGHAVQHARQFVFARIRSALVPTAQLGSSLSFPLIMAGVFMNFADLILLGVLVFAAAVLFQIVTLPVEFDASRRAMLALSTGNMLPSEQISGARQVLTAAALTYVAATAVAVLQLIYFLSLARR